MATSLDQARDQVPGALAAAEADVEAARAAVERGGAGADVATRLAAAQQQLIAAKAAAGGPQPDVLEAYRQATAANASADAVLASARHAQSEAARRQAMLQAAIGSAEMSVNRAGDFIQTRRGGIGTEPRTRLVEAQRLLAQARTQAATNPTLAVQTAQRAQQLADTAYRSAGSDFALYDRSGQRPDLGVGGAIIGGIIGGMLSGGTRPRRGGGGSRAGGGFGGTRWGSGGGTGGGRSSGGSFGGRGGRSRGGRW